MNTFRKLSSSDKSIKITIDIFDSSQLSLRFMGEDTCEIILKKACQKLGFEVDKYVLLTSKSEPIDLDLPISSIDSRRSLNLYPIGYKIEEMQKEDLKKTQEELIKLEKSWDIDVNNLMRRKRTFGKEVSMGKLGVFGKLHLFDESSKKILESRKKSFVQSMGYLNSAKAEKKVNGWLNLKIIQAKNLICASSFDVYAFCEIFLFDQVYYTNAKRSENPVWEQNFLL